MRIRHLTHGEDWPTNCPVGIPAPMLDHDWCWLVVDDLGRAWGALMACPMHRAICLLRVVIADGAPNGALLILLRGVLREAKSLGYGGFITMIEPGKRCGKRLSKLAARIGGVEMTDNFRLVAGTLERL